MISDHPWTGMKDKAIYAPISHVFTYSLALGLLFQVAFQLGPFTSQN